ncbi:NACHT, LRR and PYD domains-containing protein 3-like isoform X2 [Dendropsophus ebraccatus]|uniref:NACHT, LRR and PYD domains-containing protein 3-like isoform X2 n=1 Tax=Dendropsophus ebraccatus TaxID=150705 RepID=UPI0038311EE4
MAIKITEDDDKTQQFYQQLFQYEDDVLRMTYHYFQDDLEHIMENICRQSLLRDLCVYGVSDAKKYVGIENDRRTIARELLQDIYNRGREAVKALWVSLHIIQRHHDIPGLQAVLEKLRHKGDSLIEEILLDKKGHQFRQDLIDVHNRHKKYLYEKTEKLTENKPSKFNEGEESFPFYTRYANLIIVSTDHFRERSENELIETGVKHKKFLKKEQNIRHISPNKLFRWCHQSRLAPHMVMVSGVPGVGKTTLMQKFVYDWVRGELYQRFSFVFFFKFRELNRLDEVSLETMILQQYPYLEQQIENILQDPEKLLFIFDGLDESNHTMDFSSDHLCSNPRERGHCGQIVVSLVRKSLLNGCSVLMTSRPTRLASIDCKVFQRIVEITGFSPEERRTYFENFFSDPELAEKAFSYVKQNDTLYTFCYLPSYCWIICTVLSRSFQTPRGDQPASLLPKTVTQLFAIFIANILANHSLDKSDAQKILQSIGWMAEHGVMNHLVIFDDRDLGSFHVNNKSKLLSSFLIESEEPVTYSFLHLTVQEFFSALVHYVDYSPEKLLESLNRAKSYPDGRGEMFLRFLCGLSDASTRSMLTGYLDRQANQASIDVITWLHNFILDGMEETEDKKRRLLRTFFYLYETRNKPLVMESLKSHRSLDFSEVHMSALDCTVLAFIMETCTNIEELTLTGCSLTTEGLERLASASYNLHFLSLADNNLPETSCTPLASIIRNNQSLKRFDLSGNNLYGPHVGDMMDALSSPDCRIEELYLVGNHLQDMFWTRLASVLRKNRSLKKLVLDKPLPHQYIEAFIVDMASHAFWIKISRVCKIFIDQKRKTEMPSDDDKTRQFYQRLCQYEDYVLRITYQYFRDDLQHILESMSPMSLLSELNSRNIPDIKKYQSIENDRKTFARTLLQDIFNGGNKAVIALWVSLHALKSGSRGLQAVLEELHQRGETLMAEIILDKEGHRLSPELIDIQNHHKKYLYEKCEKLIEYIPPRCNQEEESFSLYTRYVNLIIVSTDQFRERSVNELIETGVKHEEYLKEIQNKLQRISPNKLFRWCHQSRLVPHMVMVSGVPGVGKTTLMQKFVYDWVRGELYQRFSFVFFLKFRELNQLDVVSLETMILQQYPYLEEQIENIFQDPEKLLFIFDGLDESNHRMDFTSRHLCSNPRERGHCGQIVVSLVRKSLLNGCSVLMTSRPANLASIDCKVFQRIVEITGFFPEERRTYFENFFSDPELAEKAFTYVKQNDTLYTFCYLPSYCWIICTVLSRSFQTTRGDQPASLLPKTVTQLFAIFIANILANHSLDKSDAQKILQSIGWMAEHGVMNHRIIFDDRDLDSFHVDNKSKLLSSFLMESEEPVTYSFLHLTVQEFFSALVYYIDYSPELRESLDKAKSYPDGRGEIFLRFLCGLSDASTRSMLIGYLDKHVAAQASIDVITWLIDLVLELQGLRSTEEKKQQLLRTFFYLYETRNKPLVRQSLESHTSLDLSEVHMSLLDCTVLEFIIETCTNIEELNLTGCSLETEGLERLAPALHNLWSLSLTKNQLSDRSCSLLASIIRNNPSLTILNLSSNHLSGPHFSDMVEALSSPDCRIQELHLDYNNLSDMSCTELAAIIRNNPFLKKLDLSGNHLSGPNFSDLVEALSGPDCSLEELHLANNDLPDTSCTQLASIIRNNRSLKRIDLSGNNLYGPRFSDLMEALSSPDCRIEELHLANNDLPDTSCTLLAFVIRNNQSLKRLVLSGNHLSGPHFIDLVEALSSPACRIQDLYLANNNLPDTSCTQLASILRNNPSLKILDLSINNASGELMEVQSSPACSIKESGIDMSGEEQVT